MPNETYIYAVCDPDSGKVMYVGKSNNPKKRLSQHIYDSGKRKSKIHGWIKGLLASGKAPTIKTLHVTTQENWQSTEIMEIAKQRAIGCAELNIAKGGNEPYCDKETRAMNGRNNAKKIHGDARRKRIWYLKQQIGIAIKQGYLTDRTKAKMRMAAKKHPAFFGSMYANI